MKIMIYSDNFGVLWYCPTQHNADNIRFEDQSHILKFIFIVTENQKWDDIEIDGDIEIVEKRKGKYFEKLARIVPSKEVHDPKNRLAAKWLEDTERIAELVEIERDEFALGFAEYLQSKAWESDYREQYTHTHKEHLEAYKQSLK